MPARKLARLEKEISSISTEGVTINVREGTRLHSEITGMLRKRHLVSGIKDMAVL